MPDKIPNDIQLLIEFCDLYYEQFQDFIETRYEIESSEAELILKNASKIAQSTNNQ